MMKHGELIVYGISAVPGVAFSPVGPMLATTGRDEVILPWDVAGLLAAGDHL